MGDNKRASFISRQINKEEREHIHRSNDRYGSYIKSSGNRSGNVVGGERI